jgi:outer membrane protein assembly factor BamB
MSRCLLLLIAVLSASLSAQAGEKSQAFEDNWPQWRGPLATGVAPHADPPVQWGEQSNVKWKVALPGSGSATPIVWANRIFILAAEDTHRVADSADLPKPDPRFSKRTEAPKTYYRFLVLCLDRSTGKTLWQCVATEQVPHEGHHPTHSYAAASPTTDGQRLYVSFGSRGIYCYDLDGNPIWQRDLGRLQTRLGWGEGASPAVHSNFLTVNWDHEAGSFLAVLDATTGATRWKKDRDEPTSWATPLVVDSHGKSQVIINATNRVRSYDLATGELLWQCGGQSVNAIPSPVSDGRLVYCMSGYTKSAAYAIPLDASGDVTDSDKLAWSHQRGTPYVPSPLLYEGLLYFTQSNNALLTCLDTKNGKPLVDRQRLAGLSSLYASPLGAAGRIYIADRDGTTLVLRRGEKPEILATNHLDEGCDASPVAVGKDLFLRGKRHLYCLESHAR